MSNNKDALLSEHQNVDDLEKDGKGMLNDKVKSMSENVMYFDKLNKVTRHPDEEIKIPSHRGSDTSDRKKDDNLILLPLD